MGLHNKKIALLYRDGYQNAYKIALFEVVKQGKQRLKLIYHSLGCK
jgi:hypothetical protein